MSDLLFPRHPNVRLLLPLLVVAWDDATLTASELGTLKRFIDERSVFSGSDPKELDVLLDPASPPDMATVLLWKQELRKAAEALPATADLIDLAVQVAGGLTSEEINDLRGPLAELEQELGIIGGEAVHLFREGRSTVTTAHVSAHSFDVAALSALLNGDQAHTIQRVKDLLADPAFTLMDKGDIHAYREQVLVWCQRLAKEGLGALHMPKEHGGADDLAGYFAVMETLSYFDLSLVIKFGVQFGLWGMSVRSLGTEKHHAKYLRDIGTLALPGCFAMTETGHGSNVNGIRTTATYDHASRAFIIHTPDVSARKEYIGNAALHGRMATVFAKLIINGTDHGVNAFVVPLRDAAGHTLPGITIGDCGRKMGLNGLDNGTIQFDRVVIPKDEMLDRFASVNDDGVFESPITSTDRRFFTMLGTLVGGRIGVPRSGLAAAKSGLAIAIRYSDQRTQFGPTGGAEVPILNYRMHQRRLMPLLANAYALHFALGHLTDRFLHRTEEDMREIEALAAGMKAYATWNTTATLQQCRECCGGKGYLSENRIDALKNDTEIFTTFEGDNTVLMQLVAKGRLTAFKQRMGDLNVFSAISYLAQQARTGIAEKNPIITRNTETPHLLDTAFHLSAFRYRENELLASVARRLKHHIEQGMDSFDATNVVQHHLLQMAEAYVERVVLEQFVHQLERTADAELKTALARLCNLFALAKLEQHAGWYLEQGYMEPVKTKALRKLVDQLCWELRPSAVALVDAFGIPDKLLAAPISRM